MKKIYQAIILLLGTVSCINEVEIKIDGDQSMIVVNASLRTDQKDHNIYLSTSTLQGIKKLEGATVTVKVNDSAPLTATFVPPAEEYYRYSTYTFTASLKASDIVRIDVSHPDGYKAWCEVEFPGETPFRVSEQTEDNDYFYFKAPVTDRKGEENWYRISLDPEIIVNDSQTITYDQYYGTFDTDEDPLLNQNLANSASNGSDDLFGDLFDVDTFSSFTDETFRDSEYTVRIRSSKYYYSAPANETDTVEAWANIHLHTMTFLGYRYIMALSSMELFGYESTILAEPTTIPVNVNGGIGFVSAETITTARVPVTAIKYDPTYY